MEIKNYNRMVNAYKSVTGAPPKGKGKPAEAEKAGGENFDKVEINIDRSIEAAKANIKAELSASADSGRLEMLKAAYEGDLLPTTPEQIAETIVD